jgi:hypothetical protein
MRKILWVFVLVCWVLGAPSAFAENRELVDADGHKITLKESSQPGFFWYDSEASPFAVEIPDRFTKLVSLETDNRGETFVLSDDEGAERFKMIGTRLVAKLTIAQYYKSSLEELKVKPAYKRLGKDFFVLSWIQDGLIYYQKSVINVDCLGEIEISYPAERKKEFDPLVTQAAKSLK